MHGVIGYSREGLDWCSRGWMFCLTFGASLGDAAGPGAASSEPLRSAHQMPLSTKDRRSSGDSVCRRTAISLGCRSHLNAGCETQNLLNSGPKHVPASYLRRSAWVATGDTRSDAGLNFQQARQARPHRSRGRHTRSAQPSRHSSRVIVSGAAWGYALGGGRDCCVDVSKAEELPSAVDARDLLAAASQDWEGSG